MRHAASYQLKSPVYRKMTRPKKQTEPFKNEMTVFTIRFLSCRVMGSVLDAWCNQNTLKGIDTNKLSNALEQARLSYHAQAIRSMNGDGGGKLLVYVYLSVCLSRLRQFFFFVCVCVQALIYRGSSNFSARYPRSKMNLA